MKRIKSKFHFHKPVLLQKVLYYLNPTPNENFIDCTVGLGGYLIPILKKTAPKGRILGIDADCDSLELLKSYIKELNFSQRVVLECDNFLELKDIVKRNHFQPINGLVFDLGWSSWQLEHSRRGFSFLRDEHLLMNYSSNSSLTAEKIVNRWPKEELIRILKEFGEERFARRIAEKIVQARRISPIKTTSQLVDIIKQAVPLFYQRRKIHPATKTFQALRIAVNQELKNLEETLPQIFEIASPGARIVIVSFHSLEDRIVKRFFKSGAEKGIIQILTKKPIRPDYKEILNNPRSRSARLRAGIILK